jgi:hypothetical protein
MSRGGIILIGLGLLLYPVFNRGKGSAKIVGIAVLAALAAFFALDRLPNSDRIANRFSTLSHMQDDGSFQSRLGIVHVAIPRILGRPMGFGMGSTGLGGRLNTGSLKTRGVVGDGGYLALFTSMGLPGVLCFAGGVFALWRHLSICSRFGLRDDYLGLARVLLIVMLIGMFVGNFFTDFGVMWIAFGRTLSPMMLKKLGNLIDEPSLESSPASLGSSPAKALVSFPGSRSA